jgi:response regulator RpfG family c-di-GMP phosphodiesterase
MQRHADAGARIIDRLGFLQDAVPAIRHHHECWDGSGYPDGLKGEEIPLGSRILFVCGAFQDMTSERPHRPAREAREALSELALGAGGQFDPAVVTAFEQEFAPPEEAALRELGRTGRRALHVLVADDDAASRFLLARAIDAAGQRCTTAEEGMSAWRAFRRLRPDVVICDSRLPKMNAERLCRRIRHEEGDRQTYFVTLVALQPDDTGVARRGEPGRRAGDMPVGERIQRGLDTGADDFLAKPFDREDLQTLLAVAFNEVSLRQDPQ